MLLNAEEIKNLKARVKAECLRRSFENSVAAYGGTNYDYTTVPASGGQVKKEHYDKIATPLNTINADKVSQATAGNGQIIMRTVYTTMDGFVTLLEKRVKEDTSGTDCKGSCAGLCYSTCVGGCTNGCQGTCEGTCSGGCTSCSGCAGSCSGCTGCSGCSGCTSCSGSCSGCTSCSGTCKTGCQGYCYTTCTGGCTGCSGTCTGYCTGCSGGCTGSCTGLCYNTCKSTCTRSDVGGSER